MSWQSYFRRYSTSFSFVGLVFATLLFAGSLSPSLLPRPYLVQGLLSGLSTAVGYGIGVFFVWLWQYLEIPAPGTQLRLTAKCVSVVGVAIITISFLWRAAVWQNSIRTLMEMQPVATAYPFRVAVITLFSGVILIAGGRLLGRCWKYFANRFRRLLPRRVANVLSVIVVGTLVIFLANGVLAKAALRVADAIFLRMDGFIDEGVEQPTETLATGSEQSLISWDSIGRQGKDFIALGPTQKAIGNFWRQEAMRPLRVYVGLGSKDTSKERAKLALAELKRVGVSLDHSWLSQRLLEQAGSTQVQSTRWSTFMQETRQSSACSILTCRVGLPSWSTPTARGSLRAIYSMKFIVTGEPCLKTNVRSSTCMA